MEIMGASPLRSYPLVRATLPGYSEARGRSIRPGRGCAIGGGGEFSGSYTATGQPASRVQSSLFAVRLPPGQGCSPGQSETSRNSGTLKRQLVTVVRFVRVGATRVRLVRVWQTHDKRRAGGQLDTIKKARQDGLEGASSVSSNPYQGSERAS